MATTGTGVGLQLRSTVAYDSATSGTGLSSWSRSRSVSKQVAREVRRRGLLMVHRIERRRIHALGNHDRALGRGRNRRAERERHDEEREPTKTIHADLLGKRAHPGSGVNLALTAAGHLAAAALQNIRHDIEERLRARLQRERTYGSTI